MKKTLLALGIALAGCGPALSAETMLTGPQIRDALSGHTYRSADPAKDAEQIFQVSGATFYTENGSQSQGRWEVRGDEYCSNWPPGENWACYAVASDGPTVTFIAKGGTRYAMTRTN